VVAIIAKEIIISFRSQGFKEISLQIVGLAYAKKVISSTIQAKINSYMFGAEFVLKKLFLPSAVFFPAKVSAGYEF